jgi:hypothetical protein
MQSLSEEALESAKKEAEAAARQQFEAIANDGSKTEEQRRQAKAALRAQKEEMEAMTAAVRGECREREREKRRSDFIEGRDALEGGRGQGWGSESEGHLLALPFSSRSLALPCPMHPMRRVHACMRRWRRRSRRRRLSRPRSRRWSPR